MGIGDLFKAKQNADLREQVAKLEAMLTPEMLDSINLQERIDAQRKELSELREQIDREYKKQLNTEEKHRFALQEIEAKVKEAKQDLIETNEEVLMQSFGLYQPRYAFSNSSGYKEALENVRQRQKDTIKSGTAATGATNWTVNGSAAQGRKMVADMQKLLIRAFNCECSDVIDHVKFNNVETAEKRIESSFSAISKLGSICGVAITGHYRKLKLEELHLAHEYQIEKQKEKERVKELRAEERERAKLEKEIEAERKRLEKEQQHYANALRQILQQLANADPTEIPALEEKKAELEAKASDINSAMQQVNYRAANQKAGYVYIISNVGAFGDGIYKIGMTRRLEPMDRIDELGDASVPFNFDVHALIFSEDAPALETALHHAFEDRKLNMINTRREFFRVSLDEIKAVVKKNFDKTVEFIDIPPAEQFRQSELIRTKKI